jgi:hypothetical protein
MCELYCRERNRCQISLDVLRGATHIGRLISQSFIGVVGLAAGIDIDSRGAGQHRLSALTSSDLGIADHSAGIQ